MVWTLPNRSFAQTILLTLALLVLCGVVVAVLVARDLARLDLGNVVVHKEGVGPGYDLSETVKTEAAD